MQKKAARGRSMKARPTQSRKGVKGGLRPFSSAPCRVKGQRPLWGLGQRPNCSAGDQHLKRTQQRRRQRSVPASNFARPQTRPQAVLLPQDSVKKQKNCLLESNFSGRQEIHSLMANIFVDRYRSPVSGRMTTMFLPANSGRAATCDAAQTAAPDVMPASTPSCAASSRPVR